MNKPASMSHKEWMIKKLALSLNIPEKIIEAVINNQFDSANEALVNNNSIEFSGFAKFVFNISRANKRMLKYESMKALYESVLANGDLTEALRRNTQKRLDTVLINIKALKEKLS